jgi:hypothetical protein
MIVEVQATLRDPPQDVLNLLLPDDILYQVSV